jgi:Cd2+/Zn2+-exporting ATPase
MQTQVYHVKGLDCADCASVIKVDLEKMPEVKEVKLNFTQGTLHVSGEVTSDVISSHLHRLGFELAEAPQEPPETGLSFRGFWETLRNSQELRMTLPGLMLLALSLLLEGQGLANSLRIGIQLVLLVAAGFPMMRRGMQSLVLERKITINMLMSLALIGAVLIDETQEALIMLVLFNISEAMEEYTNDHARAVLAAFADLAPHQALKLTQQGEEMGPIEPLQIGDVILVKAGERFPMDGVILEGSSEVNQAPVTGESRLILKIKGDAVISGTVNGQGVLKVRVTARAEDTTIQRIINLVTEAQSVKAKQEKFIDRFASVYTPIVVLVAVLVATVPPLFFSQPLMNTATSYGWLHRALSLLMIGCPCALVISTPITIISGLTRAAREGVIFKGGVYLENLSQAKLIAFDKTGTLTLGRPVIATVKAVDCQGTPDCEPCNDLVALASSLERYSNHPLGQAVTEEAQKRRVLDRYAPAEAATARSGQGQVGYVNGKLATVGSRTLFEAEHKVPSQLLKETITAEANGQTTMLVCDGERVRGFMGAQDTLRPEAQEVIRALKERGFYTVMLTGDNPEVAERVSEELGLDEVHAGLLPEEKWKLLAELREKIGTACMIGDGSNDSPALASADVGIGMGGAGNAHVLETADVVLMNDNLSKLPFAVDLSRYTNKLIRQNIIISLGVKFSVALFALLGLTPLWMAVLADIGITLVVTLNGLRALHFAELELV